MNVLVRGVGNIGTTLANLLISERAGLGIDRVFVHKHTTAPYLEVDLDLLRERGAEVSTGAEMPPSLHAEVDFVFDCRAAGMPRRARSEYDAMPRLRGAVAQGTEESFGIPFVTGINDAVVPGARFVRVASCNAHAIATILCAAAGPRLEDLEHADFVVVRRSEDLGAHERLVGGTVVARHRDPSGTHHALAVRDLYATLGVTPNVTSSDVTTPSQLMHTVRFALTLAKENDGPEVRSRLESSPYLASTAKFDANRIFELGRRYGFQGRIYAHAIVVTHDLMVHATSDRVVVRGWAFVPQEGNTLLSTLDAYLLRTVHPDRMAIRERIRSKLIRRTW